MSAIQILLPSNSKTSYENNAASVTLFRYASGSAGSRTRNVDAYIRVGVGQTINKNKTRPQIAAETLNDAWRPRHVMTSLAPRANFRRRRLNKTYVYYVY